MVDRDVERPKIAEVYLTRRNLLVLLSKLDRNREESGASHRMIVKRDTAHPTYPCSHITYITAVEDEDYYADRVPGAVAVEDELKLTGF